MYSNSKLDIDQVLLETSSGGAVINDSIIHLANTHLPFGGVGESGMGRSHGVHGFRTFSNEKSILRQGALGRFMRVTYPPYTPFKMKLMRRLIKWKI
ncbi:Coniferyl aldehyde dehydrogenase [compost metagenome]